MKSIVTLCAFLLIPLSLPAMTLVPDEVLSTVVCQAGVSINPDITMDIHADVIAWGDSDGINPSCGVNPWPEDGQTEGGYVGMTNLDIKGLRVRLRDNDTYGGYNPSMMKPLTIDVATGYKPDSAYGANTTFVRIAPGSMLISMESMQFDVALGPHSTSSPQLNQTLGVVSMGAAETYVNPKSYIDTYAHGKSGVTFEMNVVLDGIKIPYVSWGNAR
jgi:hypothetical protein